MGTVTVRTRRDGSKAYTAQIRLMRGGKAAFSQAQTFDSERAAKAWIVRKELELEAPGAIEAAKNRGITLADVLDRYLLENSVAIGKTKTEVLRALKRYAIATISCANIGSEHVVELANELSNGRTPQTVANYLSHLSAVARIAKPAWGYPLDHEKVRAGVAASKHLGLVRKSRSRTRRPSLDELDKLMDFFGRRSGRTIPMQKIIVFALFSTRRQAEITRIRWDDLESDRVLVRDMKHPGEKDGNNVWCELPAEARRVVDAMPRKKAEIFPFHGDTISIAFTRACHVLGIEDLHFHDLRHEGITRLIEMGRTIPMAASVSGHRNWQTLQRYAHVRKAGDKYEGWKWLEVVAPP